MPKSISEGRFVGDGGEGREGGRGREGRGRMDWVWDRKAVARARMLETAGREGERPVEREVRDGEGLGGGS